MATPNFHVIEFMVLPSEDINSHVCIPASWIQWREPDHVVVAYPEEDTDATNERVRSNASYSESWRMYRARIVHSSDTYEGVANYINSDIHDSPSGPSNQLIDGLTDELTQSSIGDEESQPNEEGTSQANNLATPSRRVIKNKFYSSPEYVPNEARWKLRHPEPGLGLVEVEPGSRVYINEAVFQRIQRTANDHKELARFLLEAVFSDKALTTCSRTGEEAPLDYDGSDVRPGLDTYTENVILRFVERFGNQREWGIADIPAIKRSMMNRLYKIRPKNPQ